MKRTIVLLVLLQSVVFGQIRSITTSADVMLGLSKRLNVQKASGIGGSATIRLALSEDYSIGLMGGYATYALDQTDQLNQWNWNFWNDRYYPKIQSDMRADPNLSAVIGSVQSMAVIPVAVSVDYRTTIGDNLDLLPSVGVGAAFFTRKLYADETWTKQFPQANYTFTYNLRNFAPEKKGTAAFIALGCDAVYGVSKDVSAFAGAHVRQYVTAVSGNGEFPFTNAIGLTLGLSFHY